MNPSSTAENSRRTALPQPLLFALIIGFCLRIIFAVCTPVSGESEAGRLSTYNDEPAHVNYILHIQQSGALPVYEGSISEGGVMNTHYENYQPPLYYLAVAGITGLLGIRDLNGVTRTARFLNVLLFAALLWIYKCIINSVKLNHTAALPGWLFLLLGGVFVRFSSTATNDVLFWLIAGGIVCIMLRMLRQSSRAADLILLTALLILGLYTKLSILLLLPLPLLAVSKSNHLQRVAGIFVSYSIIFLFTIPLWRRNIVDFGSLLPLEAGFGPSEFSFPAVSFLQYSLRSFIFPWSEFWRGWTGLLFILIPLAFFAVFIIRERTWRPVLENSIFLFTLSAALLAFLWLNCRYDQAEGRYLYLAWPVLCFLLSGTSVKQYKLWGLAGGMLVPYLLPLLYI